MLDLFRFFVLRPPQQVDGIVVRSDAVLRHRTATSLDARRAVVSESEAKIQKWAAGQLATGTIGVETFRSIRACTQTGESSAVRSALSAIFEDLDTAQQKELLEVLGDLYGCALLCESSEREPLSVALNGLHSTSDAATRPVMVSDFAAESKSELVPRKRPTEVADSRAKKAEALSDALRELEKTPTTPRVQAPVEPTYRAPSTLQRLGAIVAARLGFQSAASSTTKSGPINASKLYDYQALSSQSQKAFSELVPGFSASMSPGILHRDANTILGSLIDWDQIRDVLGAWEPPKVRPSGIADLLLVRQQTVAYDGADMSHVENALRGEHHERTHRRFTREEDSILEEESTERREERDLQTADRLEMRSEINTLVKQDASLRAGAAISASYGGMVTVSGSVDGQTSTSSQEATTRSTQFAREMTARAVVRLDEKRRVLRERRTIRELEETTKHGIDNANGDGHIIGLYQWIDRLVEGQLYNYGQRMMFDFVIPEPGWFYRNFRAQSAPELPVPPPPLTRKKNGVQVPLEATDLTEANYTKWGGLYAVDLPEPPRLEVNVSLPLAGTIPSPTADNNPSPGLFTKEFSITIPEGYDVTWIGILGDSAWWTPPGLSAATVTVTIGRMSGKSYAGQINWGWDLVAANVTYKSQAQTPNVAGAITLLNVCSFGFVITLQCWRTPQALRKWQEEAFAKLQLGYNAMMSAYREAIEKRLMAIGQSEGESPAAGDRLIREELHKYCLMIFASQYFDNGSAAYLNEFGHPELNRTQTLLAEPYIRFLEEAFEWEYLIYLLYPYFWADQERWDSMLRASGLRPDEFSEFLRAGAARVTVPVRPGFEDAVSYFLETGKVWLGQGKPPIGTPLYVSIIDEMLKRMGKGPEVAVGKPWRYRVPTGLVRLRDGSELPRWEQQPDGTWLEVKR